MKTPLFILAAISLTACGSQAPAPNGVGANALPCKGSLLVDYWRTDDSYQILNIYNTCTGEWHHDGTTNKISFTRPAADSGYLSLTIDGNPWTCSFNVNTDVLNLNCGSGTVRFYRR